MKKIPLIAVIILKTFILHGLASGQSQDYWKYHEQINEAEKRIGDEKFQEALNQYESVFEDYDFVFLRDYKIAAQLAFYLNQEEKGIQIIRKGIAAGWAIKSIKRHKYLSQFLGASKLELLEASYAELRNKYDARIDESTRNSVRQMFKKDQKMALGALLRIGENAKIRYNLNKFAPHSERQLKQLIGFLEDIGYPGEQLIGNNYWMSTILSHHNSIAPSYVKKDTLYRFIKPKLGKAIGVGQISPYEFALIEDWLIAVKSGRTQTGYGFLNSPTGATLMETNRLRMEVGLRTVELRNQLIDIEKKTGMNFHLPDWVDGKIIIEQQ